MSDEVKIGISSADNTGMDSFDDYNINKHNYDMHYVLCVTLL